MIRNESNHDVSYFEIFLREIFPCQNVGKKGQNFNFQAATTMMPQAEESSKVPICCKPCLPAMNQDLKISHKENMLNGYLIYVDMHCAMHVYVRMYKNTHTISVNKWWFVAEFLPPQKSFIQLCESWCVCPDPFPLPGESSRSLPNFPCKLLTSALGQWLVRLSPCWYP